LQRAQVEIKAVCIVLSKVEVGVLFLGGFHRRRVLEPLSDANARYFHGQMPTWNDFVEHPNHDFWTQHAVTTYLKHTTVPNLNVAGWYDQEDFVGPTRIYATLEKTDKDHLNYFVAGPWNQGGWMDQTGRKLGDIDWGSDIARYYRARIFAPWFAHWLHDKPLKQPEAITFETGSNMWKSYEEWPPNQHFSEKKLYFRPAVSCRSIRPSSRTHSTPTFPILLTRFPIGRVRSLQPTLGRTGRFDWCATSALSSTPQRSPKTGQ
jgi:X-Pro dipeptidyl-peptidase (S15 family)